MKTSIVKKIEQKLGHSGLVEMLAEKISSSELQSLLMAVFHHKTQKIKPESLLQQYQSNPFFTPTSLDFSALLKNDLLAISLLPKAFELIGLSPVSPLGSSAAIATVHQNKIVSTIRHSEVVSDCSNVLALETALRRKKLIRKSGKSRQRIKLATSHRLLRAHWPKHIPEFKAHFQVFSLVTAGRDEGHHVFETDSLVEHISFYMKLLEQYQVQQDKITIQLVDFSTNWEDSLLKTRVYPNLSAQFSKTNFSLNENTESQRNYYAPYSFGILVHKNDGTSLAIADGGFTDWNQQLLSDRKERLLISGIGTELLIQLFGPST